MEQAVDLIHIHEDDWGLCTLHPLAAEAEVFSDISHAAAEGERNRDPSGAGWTDVHIIQKPSISYADLGLSLVEAATVLQRIMPRVRRFHSDSFGEERDPNGSYDDDAWCFGFDRLCFIKLEIKADLVEEIWFDLWGDDPRHMDGLRRGIEAIDPQRGRRLSERRVWTCPGCHFPRSLFCQNLTFATVFRFKTASVSPTSPKPHPPTGPRKPLP